MTTPIQFATAKNINNNLTSTTPMGYTKPSFTDLILKQEYSDRRVKFSPGENWVRIVPALAGSKHDYMMGIKSLDFEGGRFAHPRTLERGANSVFDYAYQWTKAHCPEALYSKTNKHKGVRLLTKPLFQCFIIVEESGHNVIRILQASSYDGARNGTAGMGYRLRETINKHDKSRTSIPDAVDADKGVYICIEKTIEKGNPRPIYDVRIGKQAAPIAPIFEEMEAEEIATIVPLENTIRRLTEEEEWECLGKVIAPANVEKIRADRRH